MKVGDVIARKDTPHIAYKIVSENKKWPAWNVELYEHGPRKGLRKKGMVFKDDNRWFVIDIEASQ